MAQGALRLIQRSKAGHLLEVRVPEEIRREKQNAIENRTGGEDEGGAGATIGRLSAEHDAAQGHPRARARPPVYQKTATAPPGRNIFGEFWMALQGE